VNREVGEVKEQVNREVGEVKEQVNREIGEVKEQMNREVGEVKVHLDRIERETLGEMQARLGRIEKVRMNSTKVNPYDKVEKIGRYIHGVGYQEPTFFPKTARDFWKLKQIPKDKNTRGKNSTYLQANHIPLLLTRWIVQRLIYLVDFYGIDDYHHWGKSYSDRDVTDGHSDSDEGHSDEGVSHSDSSLSMSLEEAVATYPSHAVEKLAAILGLVEDNFTEFRRRAARYNERHQQPLEKRLHLQADGVGGEDTKRSRVESPHTKPKLSLGDFILPDTKPDSSPQSESRIGYGSTSREARERLRGVLELRNALQPSTPEPHSEGSPAVPNESPIGQGHRGPASNPQSQPSSQRSRRSGRKAKWSSR
jgi:hypothetical protein